jgi:putative Holliday junction resolvase
VIFGDIKGFKKNIGVGCRLVGLDFGTRRIGIALSDRDWCIATPKFVLERKSIEKDIDIITKYIEENGVGGIILGLPLNSEGEDTICSKLVKKFAVFLNTKINLPMYLHNEFLSSFEAEDFLINKMSTKCVKARKIVDKVAASRILQEVLDLLCE